MFVITKKKEDNFIESCGWRSSAFDCYHCEMKLLENYSLSRVFFCLISTSSLVLWGGRVWSPCFVSNTTVFVCNKFWEAIHKVLIERNFLFFSPVVISWVQTEIIQLFVCVWQKSSLSFLFDKVKKIVHRER